MIEVLVTSEPTGAQVHLDKKPMGPTPLKLKLKAGQACVVSVDKSGFEGVERRLVPGPGKTSPLQVVLKKKSWWPF